MYTCMCILHRKDKNVIMTIQLLVENEWATGYDYDYLLTERKDAGRR